MFGVCLMSGIFVVFLLFEKRGFYKKNIKSHFRYTLHQKGHFSYGCTDHFHFYFKWEVRRYRVNIETSCLKKEEERTTSVRLQLKEPFWYIVHLTCFFNKILLKTFKWLLNIFLTASKVLFWDGKSQKTSHYKIGKLAIEILQIRYCNFKILNSSAFMYEILWMKILLILVIRSLEFITCRMHGCLSSTHVSWDLLQHIRT